MDNQITGNSMIAPALIAETRKLFVAMSSSQIKPEFSGTGNIQTSADGNSATMTMMARGGFGKGQKEKKQSGIESSFMGERDQQKSWSNSLLHTATMQTKPVLENNRRPASLFPSHMWKVFGIPS